MARRLRAVCLLLIVSFFSSVALFGRERPLYQGKEAKIALSQSTWETVAGFLSRLGFYPELHAIQEKLGSSMDPDGKPSIQPPGAEASPSLGSSMDPDGSR